MKKIILLSIALFFTPSTVLADAADFDETDYVFRSFITDTPADIQECFDIGAPFVPDTFAHFDLYSLQSKKTNGIVLKDNIKVIGHVLTCFDGSGIGPENPFDLFPAHFKVTLDGMEFIVQGQARFLSFDIPEFPLGMVSVTARVVDGPSELIGGWLVSNSISNVFGLPGYVNGSFATIRLFSAAVNKSGQ